mmetsp:Transcript_12727/g.44590  ORF Transcript_12727/g.44590 Transcript_12727/m.44590 type:complete len:201 (-) Transcript_12727:484-1086(-)
MTSSTPRLSPCCFSKAVNSLYSSVACSFGIVSSAYLKMARARSSSLHRVSKRANWMNSRSSTSSAGSSSAARSYTRRASASCPCFRSSHRAYRRYAVSVSVAATYRSYTARACSVLPARSSKRTYASHAWSPGSHVIHRSNTARAPLTLPTISSMYVYLSQNWSTRGSSVTARSHTLRARFTNLLRISISAYRSHSGTCW